MKNIVLIVLVGAGLFYTHRSCGPVGEHVASETRQITGSHGGGAAREWQRAPNTLIEMQGAMGSGGSSAGAARDAVSDQVGR